MIVLEAQIKHTCMYGIMHPYMEEVLLSQAHARIAETSWTLNIHLKPCINMQWSMRTQSQQIANGLWCLCGHGGGTTQKEKQKEPNEQKRAMDGNSAQVAQGHP